MNFLYSEAILQSRNYWIFRLESNLERSAQVWQIVDKNHTPLNKNFPSREIRELLLRGQNSGSDLFCKDPWDQTLTLIEAFPPPNQGALPHLALNTIRRSNLPSEESGGRIVPLSIPRGNGLAYGTHFVFCPRNIVVCLFNNTGPRISRLGTWFEERMGIEVDFVPVYRDNVTSLFNSLTRVVSIELTIPASQVAQRHVRRGTTRRRLFPTLTNAAELMEYRGTINLTISAGVGQYKIPARRMAELGLEALSLDKNQFKTLKVGGKIGDDPTTTYINLLHDQLVARKMVEPDTERIRDVSVASAYDALTNTYEEFKTQIENIVRELSRETLQWDETIKAQEAT